IAIRIFSFRAPEGLIFMDTLLLPRSWDNVVARNRETLRRAFTDGSYLIYDNLLGWTVGPNRRSANGLYFNSMEAIRSPRPNIAFANIPATFRIALVGDSFTFGLEVKYEESWGHLLEHSLGPEFQVLNFGVDGYGVDQAYLRYYRDVRPWHPNLVIFGLINQDFYRTMAVYTFVSFPEWEFPFAKPRFVVRGGQLATLNVPLPLPDVIFSKDSIEDLPFIEYDMGYNRTDWQWHYYHLSHLARFVVSRWPRWEAPTGEVSDAAMLSINSEILRSFVKLATAEGSTPVIVYFPSRRDFLPNFSPSEGATNFAQSVFRAAGIEYIDLTQCIMEINGPNRFIVGHPHYSPQTNAVVAKCLHEAILNHLPITK